MRATVLVGSVLRYMRKEKKLSQEQLAIRAKLTTSYIGMLERGLKSPTVDTLEKLANALEVKIEELFIGTQENKNTHEVYKLSEKIKNLPEGTKTILLESLNTITGLIVKAENDEI